MPVAFGGLDSSGPFRVLIVHNAYQNRGGEDAVFEAERDLLSARGHPVATYERHNDEASHMGQLALLRDTIWSSRSHREVTQLISDFRPDVVHLHNSFPLVSPSVIWAARAAALPVVQTIHNFRLLCPQAMLLRDGRVCEDCVGHVPWRAVVHACYRNSVAQSAAAALMLQTHRMIGTWRHAVTRYIALNDFCREKLIEGGLPADRIRVKPNFLELPAPRTQPRQGFLFVGRLSPEKGLDVLVDAQRTLQTSVSTTVVGSGPSSSTLASIPGLRAVGSQSSEAVYTLMRSARALVLPSVWYESFPRTLVEAFANGLPVIASRLGAMAHLIRDGETGLLFPAGDAAALAEHMRWAEANPDAMASMGRAARNQFERELDTESSYRTLIEIYREARDAAAIEASRAA